MSASEPVAMNTLPSALGDFDALRPRLRQCSLIGLDFDGTLSEIVPHADDAVIAPATRGVLQRLAPHVPVAVLSGRDRLDVANRVGLDEIWYAGSHGFEISGPEGETFEHPEIAAAVAGFDAVERRLAEAAEPVRGAWVERKRAAVVLHYRQVLPEEVAPLLAAIEAPPIPAPGLHRRDGKMIVEFRPDVDWHKGKALEHLVDLLAPDADGGPLFIGDDTTDEDAFAVTAAGGVGVIVDGGDHRTLARWRVADPDEVGALLGLIAEEFEAG